MKDLIINLFLFILQVLFNTNLDIIYKLLRILKVFLKKNFNIIN